MARPTRAVLDPDALRHNLARVREYAPRSRVMAIVKADGYGHGLEWVARQLADADAFGVASVEEGERIRAANIRQPVALLEGFYSADELTRIAQQRLEPVLHSPEQVAALEAYRGEPINVWIKLDTGMHRLGFPAADAANVLARVKRCASVAGVRVMSHLASADDPADPATPAQLETFIASVPAELARSLANSAGIVGWPACHFDWVRPGIMLYGVSPVLGRSAQQLGLRPVMTLETALIAIQPRRKGEPIGYGGAWRCPEDMPVGIAAIGYGDGYPRHAVPGTPVMVGGRLAPIVGRVSMDMITLDLRACPNARIGERVVVWGEGLPIEQVAASAGTIGYELLCHVTARVPRVERR